MLCPECGRSIDEAEAALRHRFSRIARGAGFARWMLMMLCVAIVLQIVLLFAFQSWPWLTSGSLSVDAVREVIRIVTSVGLLLLAVPGVYLVTTPPPAELGRVWVMHTARWALLGAVALGVTARVTAPNDITLAGLLGALSALLAAGGVVVLYQTGEALTRELGVPIARFRTSAYGGLVMLAAVVLFAVVALHLGRVVVGRTSMPTPHEYSGFTWLVFVLGVGHTAGMMLKMFKEAEASDSTVSPSSAR